MKKEAAQRIDIEATATKSCSNTQLLAIFLIGPLGAAVLATVALGAATVGSVGHDVCGQGAATFAAVLSLKAWAKAVHPTIRLSRCKDSSCLHKTVAKGRVPCAVNKTLVTFGRTVRRRLAECHASWLAPIIPLGVAVRNLADANVTESGGLEHCAPLIIIARSGKFRAGTLWAIRTMLRAHTVRWGLFLGACDPPARPYARASDAATWSTTNAGKRSTI